MSTTHVYLADLPLAAVSREGHSNLDGLNDDAIRQSRSVSPNCRTSPIPRYERNMGFFRQLSRRFGLRSNDDLVFTTSNEDDNQSSSTDSCSSHTAATAKSLQGDNNRKDNNTQLTSVQANEYVSCASSETSSTVDIEEQLQQLQLQHERQQRQQQNKQQHIDNISNNADDVYNLDDNNTAADNNENSNDATEPAYNKERKSFARSSFSRLHRRSATSFRRAFEAFSLSSRSLSCSGVTPPPILPTSPSSSSTNNGTPIKSALKSSSNLELNKKSQYSSSCLKKSSNLAAGKSSSTSLTKTSSKTKTKPAPQRILRQPVSYTYLKGISGLPTQRVPRSSVCCQYVRR